MIPTTGEATSDRSIFFVGLSPPDRSRRRIERRLSRRPEEGVWVSRAVPEARVTVGQAQFQHTSRQRMFEHVTHTPSFGPHNGEREAVLTPRSRTVPTRPPGAVSRTTWYFTAHVDFGGAQGEGSQWVRLPVDRRRRDRRPLSEWSDHSGDWLQLRAGAADRARAGPAGRARDRHRAHRRQGARGVRHPRGRVRAAGLRAVGSDVRARVRRSGEEGPTSAGRDHLQRRHHGLARGATGARIRAAVPHQPHRALHAGDGAARAADACGAGRGRRQQRAPAGAGERHRVRQPVGRARLQAVEGLRAVEAGQHPVHEGAGTPPGSRHRLLQRKRGRPLDCPAAARHIQGLDRESS